MMKKKHIILLIALGVANPAADGVVKHVMRGGTTHTTWTDPAQ